MKAFIQARIRSFGFALEGLRYVLRTQRNAWVHLGVTIAVLSACLWLNISTIAWAVIFLTIGVVWMAECLNTAVETLVDLASPEIHPLAKIAKDVSAAAVLVMAICSVMIGIIILLPPFLQKLMP
jgi:diacylglycerol kinase (ATP)